MQLHKNLAGGEKSGKTFAIMNSEQAAILGAAGKRKPVMLSPLRQP